MLYFLIFLKGCQHIRQYLLLSLKTKSSSKANPASNLQANLHSALKALVDLEADVHYPATAPDAMSSSSNSTQYRSCSVYEVPFYDCPIFNIWKRLKLAFRYQ